MLKPFDSEITNLPYTGPGTIINSDFLNNIDAVKAKEKIIKKLEETNHGTKQTKFRLRDWCASDKDIEAAILSFGEDGPYFQ